MDSREHSEALVAARLEVERLERELATAPNSTSAEQLRSLIASLALARRRVQRLLSG
jgi:hypothetical protein